MPAVYTAAEAAKEIGTDGKTLRRFLRQDATYHNAGSGGRYSFTEKDMPALRDRFNAWKGRPRTPRNGSSDDTMTTIPDLPGLSHEDAKDPVKVAAISKARVDRLEAALKERGLHISQMKNREGWARGMSHHEPEAVAV